MILSNLSVPLVGIVDAAVMGHLDHPRFLAAVGAGAQIFGVIYMGLNFLRMGTTGLSAQAFGNNNHTELKTVLIQSSFTALSLGVVLFLLQAPIISAALGILESSPDVAVVIRDYYNIRIWSAPATLLNFVLIGWLLGRQNAKGPLWILIAINGTNITLDLVFVLLLGWKAEGVAMASVIAELTGLTVGLFLAFKAVREYPGDWSKLFHWPKLKRVFSINANILIRTLALMFSFAFMTVQSSRLGTTVLAANTLLLNFQSFMSYGLDGFANAAEALVGKAIGGKERNGFAQAIKVCMQWSVGVSVLFVLIYALFGKGMINVMTDLPMVRQTAREYLPWVIFLPLVSVWSFVYDGIYVGAIRDKEMRNIMLMSTFCVFVPSWYLLRGLNNHGLWLAFVCFMSARAILMHGWFGRIQHRNGFIES